MSIGIKIKKGLDLQLAGAVADTSAKPRECPILPERERYPVC